MKQSASSHDGISGLKVSKNMGLCVRKREREIRIVSENERKETVYFDGGETSKLEGIKLWQRW